LPLKYSACTSKDEVEKKYNLFASIVGFYVKVLVNNLSFDFGLKAALDNFLNLQRSVKLNMTYLQINSEVPQKH